MSSSNANGHHPDELSLYYCKDCEAEVVASAPVACQECGDDLDHHRDFTNYVPREDVVAITSHLADQFAEASARESDAALYSRAQYSLRQLERALDEDREVQHKEEGLWNAA